MALKRATKRDARIRFAIMGPGGSGKTRTALELATRLGKRIALRDSEGGRSRAYCELFDFDVDDELPDHSPEAYVKWIKSAEQTYDVLILDSASHEWTGAGGVLGKVDQVGARTGNKWAAWSVGTPAHQSFVDAVLQCKKHIVLTMRSKTEWVVQEGKPKAIGLGAVQREGIEYEVDFLATMDLDHRLTVIKTTNYAEIEGMSFIKPGADLAELLLKWLASNTVPAQVAPEVGVSAAVPPAVAAAPPPVAVPAVVPLPSAFESLGKQITEASALATLQAIAPVVGAAHKAGHITSAHRKALVTLYIEREAVLKAPPTQAVA